ncbi:MAG: GNAT family N-acetyltransferase [Kiloniellales bacterium]
MVAPRLVTRTIGLDAPQDWARALDGIAVAPAHSLGYNAAMALASGQELRLFVAEGEGARAICPIAERRFSGSRDLVTPYGFGGFVGRGRLDDLPRAWRSFAEAEGFTSGYLGLHPLLAPRDLDWGADAVSGALVYLIDLASDREALIGAMSSRRRTSLRRWLAEVTVISERAALTEAFVALYPLSMARLGAASVYQFGEAALRRLSAEDSIVLLGALSDSGEIEAVAMTALASGCAEYLFFASVEGCRDHSAGLIWLTMVAAKKAGCSWFNLGGGIRPNDGVAEFKRRFGATPRETLALKQIYRSADFARLCRASGFSQAIADGGRGGYFPPYYAAATRAS